MIFLRPLYNYDIDRIYEIKSNSLNYNKEFTNFDTSTVTKEFIHSWYYNLINETNTIRIGICLITNNYIIGLITLGQIDYINSKCELHVNVDYKYQGKGLGTESILLIINYVKNIIKLKEIHLNVHKDNDKAIKLYTKLGFNKKNNINNFLHMYLCVNQIT